MSGPERVIDDAICVRQWDWSETSQTLSLFCRGAGMVRALARGSRRADPRFGGGVELMTRGEATLVVRASSALASLGGWDLREVFPRTRERLPAFYAAMYMADLTHHLLQERDPHPSLFDALVGALRALEEEGAGTAAVLRYQWAALVESGLKPELDRDVSTGEAIADGRTLGFYPHLGGVGPDPAGAGRLDGRAWRVRRETIDVLRALAEGAEIAAGVEARRLDRASRLLAAHLREVIGRELGSMRALFGSIEP